MNACYLYLKNLSNSNSIFFTLSLWTLCFIQLYPNFGLAFYHLVCLVLVPVEMRWQMRDFDQHTSKSHSSLRSNRSVWSYVRAYLWMEMKEKMVLSSHREISANESIQSQYYLCVHGRLILFVWGIAIINSKPFHTRNKSQNKHSHTNPSQKDQLTTCLRCIRFSLFFWLA